MVWECSKLGKQKECTKFQSQNFKGRNDLGDISVDGRIILNWFLKKSVVNGFIYLMI